MRAFRIFCALPVVLTISSSISIPTVEGTSGGRPLRLAIESPSRQDIQFKSGWRLSFSVTVQDRNAPLAVDFGAPVRYPASGVQSWVVLRDLDGCLHAADPFGCPAIPGDELVVPFRPDLDRPGVPDQAGYPGPIVATSPPFFVYDGEGFERGPRPSVADGLNYGFNDDLPGLVVLSDVGPGRVLQFDVGTAGNVTGFADAVPLQRRNLAGLLTDVSFNIREGRPARSVIRASMNVPTNVFTQFRLLDACVGGIITGPWSCVGGVRQEIIEGTTTIVPSNGWDDDFNSTDPNATSTNVANVELRAVMVEGVAPFFVEDCTQDGRVNAADLRCMGFSLMSNEVVRRFTQMGNQKFPCFPNFSGEWPIEGTNEILVNFDNSPPPDGIICPTGGGGVTTPPM